MNKSWPKSQCKPGLRLYIRFVYSLVVCRHNNSKQLSCGFTIYIKAFSKTTCCLGLIILFLFEMFDLKYACELFCTRGLRGFFFCIVADL